MFTFLIWFFIVLFFIAFILAAFERSEYRKKDKSYYVNREINESADYIEATDLCHLNGLPLPTGEFFPVLVFKGCILINGKYKLEAQKITGVYLSNEQEVIKKEKSALGRALVGGVFLGPIGAVVGGLSGVGNNKTIKDHTLLIITYISEENESKSIVFRQHPLDDNKDKISCLYTNISSIIPRKNEMIKL